MNEQTILECVRIEQHPHNRDKWWVQIAMNHDLVISGIQSYRQSTGQWIVELPIGIKVNNPILLAALREKVIESVLSAQLDKRFAQLKDKQSP